MVYVSTSMIQILDEKLDEGVFSFEEFTQRLGGPEKALQVLLDLYAQGLLDHRGKGEFTVTDHGRRLVEAWRTSGKPLAEPWLDSRVYTMLHAARIAGGRVPAEWSQFLSERGFTDEEGDLSPEAYSVIEALEEAPKRPVLTRPVALALLQAPDGPAEKQYYPGTWLDTLEAAGLLVKSVPRAAYMALTRPGRLLKRALSMVNTSAQAPALLNQQVYEALEALRQGLDIDPDLKKMLGEIGYVTATGALTEAGRLVVRAWRLLQNPQRTTPTTLSSDELEVLRLIGELWERAKSNPGLAPTHKLVREWAEKKGIQTRHYSIGLALYHLEAMGLIEEYYDEERRKTILRLTRLAEQLLQYARPVSTRASRVLTEADEGLGFNEEWAIEARGQGLVGPGGPTKYGMALQRASREASRSLLITRLEAMILKRLPEKRSLTRDAIVKSFPGEEDAVDHALGKLESRGMVETLPDNRIVITEAGLLVKSAILAAPSGVAVPVNPRIIKLLKAVEKLRTTEDIPRLVKETRLGLDELKDALVLARACKYIGRNSVTGEGRALLEAAKLLEEQMEAEKPA